MFQNQKLEKNLKQMKEKIQLERSKISNGIQKGNFDKKIQLIQKKIKQRGSTASVLVGYFATTQTKKDKNRTYTRHTQKERPIFYGW